MKMRFRHILALLFLLVQVFCLSAQEGASVDADLDRYEVLCGMCMDLRTRVSAGEQVSRSEAQAFINRFLSLNRELKAKEAEMNPSQRRRFVSIGQWFSTGVKPQEHLPVAEVAPFMHNERIRSLSCIDGPMIPDVSDLASVVEPAVPDRSDLDVFLLAELSVPSMSYGIRAGLMVSRFGGYASFRSDFRPSDCEYSCMSDGAMPGGGMFWPSGSTRASAMCVNAGLLVQTLSWLTAYAGAGYGRCSNMWQDVDGKWAQVSDISYKGLSAEAGLILTWKMLGVSAGLSSISFKTLDFSFGLGIRF